MILPPKSERPGGGAQGQDPPLASAKDAPMADVINLKPGEPMPSEGDFLVITCVGRIRAFEYYIDPSPSLASRLGRRVPPDGPGYASLASALREAQALSLAHGVPRIYVQDSSIRVRPLFTP